MVRTSPYVLIHSGGPGVLKKDALFFRSRPVGSGGPRVPWCGRGIDELNLFEPGGGGQIMRTTLLKVPPGFSDLPTTLWRVAGDSPRFCLTSGDSIMCA